MPAKIILKIELDVPQMLNKSTLWLKYACLSRISVLNVRAIKKHTLWLNPLQVAGKDLCFK